MNKFSCLVFVFACSLCKTFGSIIAYPRDSCLIIEKNYNLVVVKETYANDIKFLNSFPNNFSSFVKFFGYTGRDGKYSRMKFSCLIDESYFIVNKFFNLKFIHNKIVYSKVLNITQHAEWQSDGVGFFQQECVNMLFKDKSFLNFLNSKSDAEIKNFNDFIINDPVEDKVLKSKLKTLYRNYNNLLRNTK